MIFSEILKDCRFYSQDSFNGNSTNYKGVFISSFNWRSSNKNSREFAPYIDGLNRNPDAIVFSETWFKETNIDGLSVCIAFNSIRTKKKTGGGLWIFCRNDLSYNDLEVSNSNTQVIEHVHVKLHSPNKKTINNVGIYRAPSHGLRAFFQSEVDKITNSFSSRELNGMCGDFNIEPLKLDNVGKS